MFDFYWIMLIVSGILMLVVAATGFGRQTTGARVFSGVLGVAFMVYGLYLGFIFTGGSYFMFYYAFAAPIFVVVSAVRSRKAQQEQAARSAVPHPPVPAQPVAPNSPHLAYLQQPPTAPAAAPPATTYQSPVQPG